MEHPQTTAVRPWTGGRMTEEGRRGGQRGKGHICRRDARGGWGSLEQNKKWRSSELRPNEGLQKRSHCQLRASHHVIGPFLFVCLFPDGQFEKLSLTRFLAAESVTGGSWPKGSATRTFHRAELPLGEPVFVSISRGPLKLSDSKCCREPKEILLGVYLTSML